jgi:hypothetical protein
MHRVPRGPLIPLALLGLTATAIASSFPRGLSWDESIYLSQVDVGSVALPFAPSRARGITLLAAPGASWHPPLAIARGWMLLVTAALVWWVVATWKDLLGTTWTIVAVSVLCSSWIVGLYATEVMPNLPAALVALVAVGAWLSEDDRTVRLVSLGGGAAALALLRPIDAVVLVGLLALTSPWFVRDGARRLRSIAWLVGGLAIGLVPWLAEMAWRFGSLGEAVRRAAATGHVGDVGVAERVVQYLDLLDGPLVGPVRPASVAWAGLLVLLASAGLIVLACSGAERRLALLPTLCTIAFALVYLVFVGGLAPRFFLPAAAMACVPIAIGLRRLWSARTVGKVAVCGFVAVFVAWNVPTLVAVGSSTARARAEVGAAARLVAGTAEEPCRVLSDDVFPQVAYRAGCTGGTLGSLDPRTIDRGEADIVIVASSPLREPCLAPVGSTSGFHVYRIGGDC